MSCMDEGTARALNTLGREQMKARLLADIAVDMTVCGLEGWSLTEYVDEIYGEAERLAIGVRRGSELPKWLHACGRCGARVSLFATSCGECGAMFDMSRPFERKLLDAIREAERAAR